MRSARGFAGADALLLALPVTLLYQLLGGTRGEAVIHAALALGAFLMALAVFDFRTPKWITLLGFISAGALAAIFFMQGMSAVMHNARLTELVYRVLGQRVEGWLVDLFLAWCIGVLLTDSRGRSKVFGSIALAVAVTVEVYANWLALRGASLNTQAPMLKLLILLPIVWLLVESRKARALGQQNSGPTPN